MGERILVADDDIELLGAIAEALAAPGRTIVRAHDGGELLEALAGESFDLVITDIDMPWMTGLQAGHTVRYLGVETPIIAISGLPDPDLELSIAELAPHARLLRKPFELATLELWAHEELARRAADGHAA